MQNEPENCKTGAGMPTTQLSSNDEAQLSKALKSQLPGDVKVLGWDHNWNDHGYVSNLVANGAVDAIGYHCYDGTNYQDQTQAVKTFMTECSFSTNGNWPSGIDRSNVAGNLGWEVSNLLMGPLRYGSSGSLYWSAAQRTDGTPYLGGGDACDSCRGLLEVSSDGQSFTPAQDFYFYGQFAKFIRPGAVRIDSSQSGSLSTVAFQQGDETVLVVLNSSGFHADGGQPAQDANLDLHKKLVSWGGDTAQQKTSWMVGADGQRRWISDWPTYQCFRDAGYADSVSVSSSALDRYPDLTGVWAVCGQYLIGTNSELEKGTYIKSGGGARLTLTPDGLSVKTATGVSAWAPPGKGDRLILQEDGRLVLYNGASEVWSSNTQGSGAAWLSISDDGVLKLSTKDNKTVWTSPIDANQYKGKIVHWDGDTAQQRSSWLVGADGKRRWIHDWDTFQCLRNAGYADSVSVSSEALDKLPDLTDVWATCGTDRIGPQGSLEDGAQLQAGDYKLVMQSNGDLVLWHGNDDAQWSSRTNNNEQHYLTLQQDGNLVLYNENGVARWSSGTPGNKPGWLVLGDDGSLRLYDGNNHQIWTK